MALHCSGSPGRQEARMKNTLFIRWTSSDSPCQEIVCSEAKLHKLRAAWLWRAMTHMCPLSILGWADRKRFWVNALTFLIRLDKFQFSLCLRHVLPESWWICISDLRSSSSVCVCAMSFRHPVSHACIYTRHILIRLRKCQNVFVPWPEAWWIRIAAACGPWRDSMLGFLAPTSCFFTPSMGKSCGRWGACLHFDAQAGPTSRHCEFEQFIFGTADSNAEADLNFPSIHWKVLRNEKRSFPKKCYKSSQSSHLVVSFCRFLSCGHSSGLEISKPGRDSNYLKTIKSTLDLRKTCAAKIHLQQKCDFCFHRCRPKMRFPKKMHNVRIRKYTRSKRASPISTHA